MPSTVEEKTKYTIPGSEEDPFTMQLLGFKLIDYDREKRTLRLGFESQANFRNPGGNIQGGMLAAMLDEVFAPLVIIDSKHTRAMVTLDLNVTYIAAAKPGLFECEGRIVRVGSSVGFLEAELFDQDGILVARASTTCKMLDMQKP